MRGTPFDNVYTTSKKELTYFCWADSTCLDGEIQTISFFKNINQILIECTPRLKIKFEHEPDA